MKTVLLITERFEPTADLLLGKMRQQEIPCMRWNLDQFPFGSALTYRASKGHFSVEIASDGRKVNLEDVGSIWCREFSPTGFPAELCGEDETFAKTEATRALTALATIENMVWINHPLRSRLANSKPAQLAVASKVGFDIPQTVITNDPEEVRRFIARSPQGKTIYKTLSQFLGAAQGKSLFTGQLSQKELAKLDLIRVSPGIFQELVPKVYEVRATVIGPRIFGAKIHSQAREETRIDWRRSPFEVAYEPIDLPLVIQSKVHALMEAFGLVYGAMDFIVTPEERYVFLEVNPAGQYMWVETETGLEITASLVDALAEPCRV